MARIECEAFRFICPYFADLFVGREALQGFETATIIIGINSFVQVGSQLGVAGYPTIILALTKGQSLR